MRISKVAIFLLFGVLLVTAGCTDDFRSAYDDGFEEGYNDGLRDGNNDGYAWGYAWGYEGCCDSNENCTFEICMPPHLAGVPMSYEEARERGYEGCSLVHDGYESGYNCGYDAGYNHSYPWGYDATREWGFEEGWAMRE
jgi:flagellar biosynthesis/type III secretory pathway protein FliH